MLNEGLYEKIVSFVKEEPKTIQEISFFINKSWVTTEKYVKEIIDKTNSLGIKHFRKGTKAALKIVYYKLFENTDTLKKSLQERILNSPLKNFFDFFEIFQFVDDNKKRLDLKKPFIKLEDFFLQANNELIIYSGNLSFLNKKVLSILESLLQKRVYIKILSRVEYADIKNFKKIEYLLKKYPNIEVRHSRQPLRGYIVDGKKALFKTVFDPKYYKNEELEKETTLFYYLEDEKWISFLKNTFFILWKSSINSEFRIMQLEKYLK